MPQGHLMARSSRNTYHQVAFSAREICTTSISAPVLLAKGKSARAGNNILEEENPLAVGHSKGECFGEQLHTGTSIAATAWKQGRGAPPFRYFNLAVLQNKEKSLTEQNCKEMCQTLRKLKSERGGNPTAAITRSAVLHEVSCIQFCTAWPYKMDWNYCSKAHQISF